MIRRPKYSSSFLIYIYIVKTDMYLNLIQHTILILFFLYLVVYMLLMTLCVENICCVLSGIANKHLVS